MKIGGANLSVPQHRSLIITLCNRMACLGIYHSHRICSGFSITI